MVAARKAQPGWAGATGYNRGQVLYRVAEVMESRKAQFVEEVRLAEGVTAARATALVEAAIDRWVWYAGWADKYPQVPVASTPSPGRSSISLCPRRPVSSRPWPATEFPARAGQRPAPIVVRAIPRSSSRAMTARSPRSPSPESLATSDVPGGVVNVLTGDPAEMAPWLASHRDVNAIDLTGVADTDLDWADLERAGADNLKRVRRPLVTDHGAQNPIG